MTLTSKGPWSSLDSGLVSANNRRQPQIYKIKNTMKRKRKKKKNHSTQKPSVRLFHQDLFLQYLAFFKYLCATPTLEQKKRKIPKFNILLSRLSILT